MSWSFTYLRMSIAEKTHNQIFRVSQVLPAPRLVKIAIFSLKILVFDFDWNRLTDSYWGRNRCGEVSHSSGCRFAEKTHNQVFRVLQVLPAPRLVKIAIFSLKILVFDFDWNRLRDSYWDRNRCGEVSYSSGGLLLRKPTIKFSGFCKFCQLRA